ncbi:MAG: extracellular solute-binding protein [Candidatus Promineifilaceae bacterium]|nr:extracellular solute-binding protein [Candidatus Promineifilaceae bacterium]
MLIYTALALAFIAATIQTPKVEAYNQTNQPKNMGNQFDWQFEEDPDDPSLPKTRRRWTSGFVLFWIAAIVITAVSIGVWNRVRNEGERETQDLVELTQAIMDVQKEAMAANDGELFFSQQQSDSSWFAAQMLPENQAINRGGLEVTNAEQHGESIWANAVWEENGNRLQRVLFFNWRAGQLQQVATDPDYWGATLQTESDWGKLAYYAVDDPWAASIANYVSDAVTTVCARECVADKIPFTIEIRDDFMVTAEPNRLHIPSPRLLGLDGQGEPADRFWGELDRRVVNYLRPATIRFAIPPVRVREGQTMRPYETLAREFMALNPEISIELVYLESADEDLSTLIHDLDGAAVVPTEAMLTAGHVHDLSDFINSDPDFNKSDFYEQIWQGTVWRERSWFIPEAAKMQVIYYDKAAYQKADHAEPSSRWTWDEMAQDVSSIVADQPQPGALTWGFLDVGLDSLFSFAYNWNNQCSETATVFCRTPLTTANVAAALAWYGQMAQEEGQMPDLTGQLQQVFSGTQMSAMESLINEERKTLLLLNLQGSQRKAAIWVDSPVSYEFNLLLSPVGVVPFPGSDRFDGITPLWLSGSFISQYSEQPLAVWQWLKFLSYQSPNPRRIPARPSVAAEMGYWTTLPRPLRDIMRTAFPFSRPVTIEEKGFLTWDQVSAVLSGASTPQEAAENRIRVPWFAAPD